MAEVRWTDEQRAAIEARGHTLLVSAAAGSGKTAVLVQRILEQVLDPCHPCDVTDFLVVTFTRAAAAEMREKMTKALYGELSKKPRNRHLQRQIALMPSAAFETIDGFYYKLVREFSGALGVSPTVRIAPETELTLLYESVRDELLEQCYEKRDTTFLKAVDYFSSSRDDGKFLEVVDQLRRLTSAHPDRAAFLNAQAALYASPPDFEKTPFGKELQKAAGLRVDYARLLLDEAMGLAKEEETLKEKYLPALLLYEQMLRDLEGAVKKGEFDGAAALLDSFEPPRFSPVRGVDEALKRGVSGRRDLVKKQLAQLKSGCFFLSTAQAREDAAALSGALFGLCDFTMALEQRFLSAKNERRMLDFSDLSHLLFGLLVGNVKDGRVTPTDTALQIAGRYREILIDEYQDTNELQDLIFRAIAKEEGNLFFVGDAKQSIYLFRQAEPRIFVEKRRTFAPLSQEGAPCRQLTLSMNFRSRSAILEFVNAVFEQAMSEQLGGLSYEGEGLRFGAFYEQKEDTPVELLLLSHGEREEDEEAEESESEAACVARQVERLLATALVTEKDGSRRRAKRGDIVVLMRSVKGAAPLLEQALAQRGIAAYSDTPEGFFERPEILLLTSLLQVVDNPLQDVPLACVLRSPLCGLSPDELAEIRLALEDQPFYYAAKAAAKELPAVARFLEQLERWRDLSTREPVERLLLTLLEDTGLMAITAAMPMGELRCENIRLLISYAAEYESTAYRGLFRFNRYLEGLRRSGRDLPAAKQTAQGVDVVRIMSIHKSKGLEFPIVVLCGLGRPRNKTDLRQRFVMHGEVGVGLKLRDTQRMVEFDTLQRAGVLRRSERETLAEELRCLYVAMTRARERLLLVVDARGRSGLSSLDPVALKGGRIHPVQLLDAASLGELLLLVLQTTSAGRAICTHYGLPIPEVCRQVPCQVMLDGEEGGEEKELASLCGESGEGIEKMSFPGLAPLPGEGASKLPGKLTVTRLKDLLRGEQDFDTPAGERLRAYRLQKTGLRRPSFVVREQQPTATEAGTAMHELVQFAYLRGLAADPFSEIDYLVERGFLSAKQRQLISIDMVKAFTDSALFSRMLSADRLRRELKFTVLQRAGDLLPGLPLHEQEEQLLLQGVIDCVYEGEEGVVLVDYKTDRVRAAGVLAQRYSAQLLLYAQAYRRMTGRRVTRAVIYSFSLGCEIEVPLP